MKLQSPLRVIQELIALNYVAPNEGGTYADAGWKMLPFMMLAVNGTSWYVFTSYETALEGTRASAIVLFVIPCRDNI